MHHTVRRSRLPRITNLARSTAFALATLAILAGTPTAGRAQSSGFDPSDVDGDAGIAAPGVFVAAPPPARMEVAPVARPGWIWAPGYWRWTGRRYVWIEGRWLAVRRGYQYVPAHGGRLRGGWILVPARWVAHVL